MFSLRLELLTGRYVASEYNNRDRPEWPPHPARVFSALVAAYHESGASPHCRLALEWLEAQAPPKLHFSEAAERDLKIHFVPVNDRALSDAATVDNAWAKVFTAERARDSEDPKDPSGSKRAKRLEKAEAGLKKAYAKAGAPSSKAPTKGAREALEHVMPATRTKQPRGFPSVTPTEPTVYLSWDEAPSAEGLRPGLDSLAAALVRVGHSSSLVAARWVEDAPAPTWEPQAEGAEVLRWVRPGQLAALEHLHSASPFAEQRVMPSRVVRYGAVRNGESLASTCFDPEFLVFRRVGGPRLPIEACERIADGFRRALMSHARDPISALISGHQGDGTPLLAHHMAVVPLPYVGSRHANGELLGIALVLPRELEWGPAPLYAAIAAWERAGEQSGREQHHPVELALGELGVWRLARELDISPLQNLREGTWTRSARRWATATPMVLDRHPGDLRRGGTRVQAQARATIAEACEHAGLPRPAQIEWSDAPFFQGSALARRFRRRKKSDHRPRVHVQLTFERPVRGPLLLGAARYRGLGLFRPLGDPT